MAEKLSRARRSWLMSQVRAKDTKPEILVRRAAHRLGYRFRLHRKDLPGRPDLVFPRHRKVIFVHGCFWHQHDCVRGDRRPATNAEYWIKKLRRNVERDIAAKMELEQLGWQVLAVWECEIRSLATLEEQLREFLAH